MDDTKEGRSILSFHDTKKTKIPKAFDLALLVQIPQKLQNCLKSQLNKFSKLNNRETNSTLPKENHAALEVNLVKQLKAWKENPNWVDQPPEIKVSVPKGSLCNLNVKVKVGLPPDAIYDIVIDPDNRRVFKNIKVIAIFN
ncbi:hypothetical protein GIB67_042697 [Kingdonia uniflora]|uniref:Uncharacterized protein n=1 Tax=Kingdonia uniflora TaxID=39325 RepID=A0A7J7NDH0_9MAGN|nr:hypothetical protein GIB67_042697 [Kingdonia uniflora]